MSPQPVFSTANAVALLAGIMLAVLPSCPRVRKMITTKLVGSSFAVLYRAIVVSLFGRAPGRFSTLAGSARFSRIPGCRLRVGYAIWPLICWSARGNCRMPASRGFLI